MGCSPEELGLAQVGWVQFRRTAWGLLTYDGLELIRTRVCSSGIGCTVAHKNWGWLNWEGSSEELWLAQVGWGVDHKNSE